MKVLFDTNVVLDVLLARAPHVDDAAILFSLVDRGVLQGVLCATTVTTLHYLAERAVGRQRARRHIEELLAIFGIAPVDDTVLQQALRLEFDDFEDAVLHEAARGAQAVAIVTRNGRDFRRATLPVFTPSLLLAAVSGRL
jgi:predicted nucleic acid-binding protein